MDGQDDAMKSAMELFAARLAKRDVERPITDHRTVERLIAMLEPHEQQVVRLRIGLGPLPRSLLPRLQRSSVCRQAASAKSRTRHSEGSDGSATT